MSSRPAPLSEIVLQKAVKNAATAKLCDAGCSRPILFYTQIRLSDAGMAIARSTEIKWVWRPDHADSAKASAEQIDLKRPGLSKAARAKRIGA